LGSVVVPVPPLDEQQRIAAILDEAFEAIAAATANAEKNLANSGEVSATQLNDVFAKGHELWSRVPLGEIATKIGSGATPAGGRDSYHAEGIALIRSMNVHDRRFKNDKLVYLDDRQAERLDHVSVDAGDVLLNITGASIARCCVAPASILPARVNQHVSIVRVPETRLDAEFLSYALTSRFYKNVLLDIGSGAGSTRQALTKADIGGFEVGLPSLNVQKGIIRDLQIAERNAKILEAHYHRKIAALAELKQSLLTRAFSGELSAAQEKLVPGRRFDNVAVSTPEQVANILALAHHRHVIAGTEKTFGHVKAQKFLHLVESVGGLELGRHPMKDAAGPNDFQHMLKAEQWAKDQEFFEFVRRRDRGYDFRKLDRYDEMLALASAAVAPVREIIDRVTRLIVPLDTTQAEVLATVHAAWNNLILDGRPVEDDAIVREARDEWHVDKQKIPERTFREMIAFIRREGIIPDGSAKRVGEPRLL